MTNTKNVKKKSLPSKLPKIRKHRLAYSRETMLNANEVVKGGIACYAVAQQFKVPRITEFYKVQGKCPVDKKCGPQTSLEPDEENLMKNLIEQWIQTVGNALFPINKIQLLDSVQKLVSGLETKIQKLPVTNDRLSHHWYESFIRRDLELTIRTPQNLPSSRTNVTEEKLRSWHKEVTNYVNGNNYSSIMKDPNRIFNADEAACQKGQKVFFSKEEKCHDERNAASQ